MLIFLIGTPLLVMIFIYKYFKRSAKRKGTRTNWFALAVSYIPIILFFGFFTSVYVCGTTDCGNPYDDHPSITDEDWLKDNYGGTEYSP